jgi:hypothetical protein
MPPSVESVTVQFERKGFFAKELTLGGGIEHQRVTRDMQPPGENALVKSFFKKRR